MFLACKVTTKKPFVQAKRVKSGWKWLFCPLTMRFGGHFVTVCCISARDKAIKPFILYYKKRTCHLQGPFLPSSCAFSLHALPSGNAPLIECQGPIEG